MLEWYLRQGRAYGTDNNGSLCKKGLVVHRTARGPVLVYNGVVDPPCDITRCILLSLLNLIWKITAEHFLSPFHLYSRYHVVCYMSSLRPLFRYFVPYHLRRSAWPSQQVLTAAIYHFF